MSTFKAGGPDESGESSRVFTRHGVYSIGLIYPWPGLPPALAGYTPEGAAPLVPVWFVLSVELCLVVPALLATYAVFAVCHIGSAEGENLAVLVFVFVEFVLAGDRHFVSSVYLRAVHIG